MLFLYLGQEEASLLSQFFLHVPEFIDSMLHNLSIRLNTVFDEQLPPSIKIIQLGLQLCKTLHHFL